MSDSMPPPPPPEGPQLSNLFQFQGTINGKEVDINYQVEHTIDSNGNFFNYKLFKNKPIEGDEEKQQQQQQPLTVLDHIPEHLKVSPTQDVLIIDSVNSGIGRENRDFFNVVMKPVLEDLQVTGYKYLVTENAQSVVNFAKSEIVKPNTTVVLFSGDTSVFEIINTVLANKEQSEKCQVNFVFVPLGTGNANAYSAGFANELVALTKLFADKISHLPIYKANLPTDATCKTQTINDHAFYFTVVVSWGIHSDIIIEADSPELKPYGVHRFQMAFQKIFQRPKIEYLSELYNADKVFVSSGNNVYTTILALPLVESKYMISPASEITENKLHLLNLPDQFSADRQELAKVLFAPYQQGAHVQHPLVFYEDVGELGVSLKFQQDGEVNICVDGAIVNIPDAKGKEVKVEILEDQSRFKFGVIGV
ncbi:hypothetical protein WICPIJ_006870 [Wickerhamomyces pijperi]|uniref:DAGKc domain-containing protein n=1 Tax=Wickerhamomyces pijperi TaxID=599730 RepID=A0A9P8TJT5_WICPI|nr:hypothetical protein WICPIJ_006870 [Wickerhamomyces pijperi]